MGLTVYNFSFDPSGNATFTEGGGPVDIGSVSAGLHTYSQNGAGAPWFPSQPPSDTSVNSVTIAVANATSADNLIFDVNALTSPYSFSYNGDLNSGTISRLTFVESFGFSIPVAFASFSNGLNGQAMQITLFNPAVDPTNLNQNTPTQSETDLAALLSDILYQSTSNAPPASQTITFTFNGTYGYGTPSVAVNINQINDQPVLVNGAQALLGTIGEHAGTSFQVSSFRQSFSDGDGPNAGIAITNATANNGHWEYYSASNTWTAIGAVGTNAALLLRDTDWVRFVGDGTLANGATANDTIGYRVWDQFSGAAGTKVDITSLDSHAAVSSAGTSASLTITGVNEAPVLPAATPTLTTITEDQVVNGGQTVASFRGTINDTDAGALKGIAITGTGVGNGHWEYSTNTGASWTDIGAVLGTSALLLRDQDLVRFIPNAQNGTTASLTYEAWDQTSGAFGTKVNASAGGGTSAFSTGSNTASLTVTPVNDTPTATNLTQSLILSEGTSSAALGIVVADVDTGDIITATLTVTTPSAGSLTTSGTATYAAGTGIWQITGSVAAVNAALAAVTFVPTPFSDVGTTITTHIQDAAGTHPTDGTITIAITPVNDAPTATQLSQTHAYVEGAASVALDAIVVTDHDPGDTITVTLTLNNHNAGVLTTTGGGAYTPATGVWTFTGSVAEVNAALAAVSFTPATDNDVNTSITVHIEDAAGAGPNGLIALNVTPVEDIATVTTTPVVTSETKLPSPQQFHIASKVTIVDADTDDAAHPTKYVQDSASVTHIDGPTPPDGTLDDLISIDPYDGTVLYDRSAFSWLSPNQHVTYTISFKVQSGDDALQDETITVTINGLNDAPVLSAPTHATFAAMTEDDAPSAAHTVASFRGPITDGDPGALTGIAITATAGNGDWQYSIDSGASWHTFVGGTASALLLLDTDLVRFAPDHNNGGQASFIYRAWDQTTGTHGNTADATVTGGASAFSSASDSVTLAVTSINDAPVVTPAHQALSPITEDAIANGGLSVASVIGIAISDVDSGALQGIALSGLTSGNGHWEYSFDGTHWNAVGAVSESAALLLQADDFLRFVPDGRNGTSASLTYHAWDRTSGTHGNVVDLSAPGATGGTTAYSTATDTGSLAVSDVNDAPVVAGPVTLAAIAEGSGARLITQAELLSQTSDVDLGHTLTAINLTIATGQGTLTDNGDGTWSYTPVAHDDTSVSFTFDVGDGIAPAIPTSATLDITGVDDAPVALSGIAIGNEDTPIAGTLVATDIDGPALTFSRVAQAAHGSVAIAADGSYIYTPDANYHGPDSFTFKANDGTLDSNIATVNLTIASVNDAPVVAGPVTLSAVVEDSGARLITQAQLLGRTTDADGDPLTAANLVLAGGHGLLTDNHDGTWSFTPVPNDDTSVSFSFDVSDGIAPAVATSATLDITPVDDAPVAHSGSTSGNENTVITGVLNATDIDNVSLSFTQVGQAAHGLVSIAADGTFAYTPAFNYHGTDSFTYRVSDGTLASNTATVDLTVNFSEATHRVAVRNDFDASGHSSILWQNTDGTAAVWSMNGLNVLSGANVGFNPGPAWHAIGTGDFNGDGHSDILWQNADGTPAVWLMNGQQIVSGANVGFNPGAAWHEIAAADFNGDGKADILWQNKDGQAAVWLMDGLNVLSGSNVGFNPGAAWHAIGAGDFDGDGKADILWQNSDGQAAVWLMNGQNLLAGANVGFNPGAAWHVEGAGDFNGDGKADILWQNQNGQAAIWQMDGLNLTAGANVGFNPGPAWQVHGSGDFNGDGKADIILQNTDGTPAVWLMDGFNVVSGSNVGYNPGASWQVIPQHHDLFT
jgi:VCBS repeat-containing protein